MKGILLVMGSAMLVAAGSLNAQDVPTTNWSDLAETDWYVAGANGVHAGYGGRTGRPVGTGGGGQ